MSIWAGTSEDENQINREINTNIFESENPKPVVEIVDPECSVDLNGILGEPKTPALVRMPVEKDSTHYNMDHRFRGKALILNFEEFYNPDHVKTQQRTSLDKEKLQRCLEGLEFHVESHDNLDKKDFIDVLKKVQEEDHSNADCLVVVVCTHGDVHGVVTRDSKKIVIQNGEVWNHFLPHNCSSLAGKPKIFIFQASFKSQENDLSDSHESPSENETDSAGDDSTFTCYNYNTPTDSDVLVVYSSPSLGKMPMPPLHQGSWLINGICQVFEESAYEEGHDLETMLITVKREVARNMTHSTLSDSKNQTSVQVPVVLSSLMRKVVFQPKYQLFIDPHD